MEHDSCKAGGESSDAQQKMVNFELEAAEALAGLAHSAMPQEETERRPSQRLKHGTSSPHDSVITLPSACDPHLLQDRVIQEQSAKASNVISRTVRDEKNDELKSGGGLCSTSYFSIGGSRSKQPLTEIEKEARRLRRVLANRESARQTIRRRQAMFEELTSKAADLALENENLKREKELALKEHDSLKHANDCLKEQMAKIVKTKAKEIPRESNPNHVECYGSAPSRTAFPSCNQPSAIPLHWLSIIQHPDANLFQSRSIHDFANPSLFPMTHTWRPEIFSGQRDSTVFANPGALLCVMPFPCFLPLNSPTNAIHALSPHQHDRQNQTYLHDQCTASSSLRNSVRGEDHQPSLSLELKTEVCASTPSIPADDDQQAGFGFPPDGGSDNSKGTYRNKMILMPTPLSCVRPPTSVGAVLNTTAAHNNASTNVEAIASSARQRETGMSEEYQEPLTDNSKIPVDASTAAEARRRRKELMKLKILQAVRTDSKQGTN